MPVESGVGVIILYLVVAFATARLTGMGLLVPIVGAFTCMGLSFFGMMHWTVAAYCSMIVMLSIPAFKGWVRD